MEDTADIRELLTEILTDEGYEVISVANGAEALEALHAQSFELVLLDLMMPIMNGFELLTRLRAAGNAHPPVVAMSAFERFRREARDLGAQSFLSKPVDIDRLLQEVNRVVSVQQLQGAAARATMLVQEALPEISRVDRMLRKLERWLQVERVTYRDSSELPNVPNRSMLVLGDASAQEDIPGGLYARVVVRRGEDLIGFLELADGKIRDLLGEELALAQFVAEWIGRDDPASSDIAAGEWGPRLSELLSAVVFEQARREDRPVLLAVIHGAELSDIGPDCPSLAFAGWRSEGEILVVGNGRVAGAATVEKCVEKLRLAADGLQKASIGLMFAAPGEVPLFSEALLTALTECRRLERTVGHGVGQVSVPPPAVTRH